MPGKELMEIRHNVFSRILARGKLPGILPEEVLFGLSAIRGADLERKSYGAGSLPSIPATLSTGNGTFFVKLTEAARSSFSEKQQQTLSFDRCTGVFSMPGRVLNYSGGGKAHENSGTD